MWAGPLPPFIGLSFKRNFCWIYWTSWTKMIVCWFYDKNCVWSSTYDQHNFSADRLPLKTLAITGPSLPQVGGVKIAPKKETSNMSLHSHPVGLRTRNGGRLADGNFFRSWDRASRGVPVNGGRPTCFPGDWSRMDTALDSPHGTTTIQRLMRMSWTAR